MLAQRHIGVCLAAPDPDKPCLVAGRSGPLLRLSVDGGRSLEFSEVMKRIAEIDEQPSRLCSLIIGLRQMLEDVQSEVVARNRFLVRAAGCGHAAGLVQMRESVVPHFTEPIMSAEHQVL